MSKNREIEAKILLTKKVYDILKQDFKVKEEFTQKNYYFDTKNWTFKKHHISLRIRKYPDHAEQTMKVPDKNPLQKEFHESIEINDNLTLTEADKKLEDAKMGNNIIFNSNIGKYIHENLANTQGQIYLFSWSKTTRILANGPKNVELTLDKTSYPDDYEDFELEIENKNPKLINTVLSLIKQKYDIGNNASDVNLSKIARATIHK